MQKKVIDLIADVTQVKYISESEAQFARDIGLFNYGKKIREDLYHEHRVQ